MSDYRLKVFHSVAERLSFTRASEQLNISQPAVTKHIKELESHFQTKLFERKGSKTTLTESGQILLAYSEKIRALYRDLEYEMYQTNEKHKGSLKIGASTTIAQYILPEILAGFNARYQEVAVELVASNSENISKMLDEGKIDLGVVEGLSHSDSFRYLPFKKDEIVAVAKSSHSAADKLLKAADLKSYQLVMREDGSGTQEFIIKRLKESGISTKDLSIAIKLGSSEAIKNYLLNSDCIAFLPISSILQELKNNLLTIIDIKDFEIQRKFHFIIPKGEQSPLVMMFLRYLDYN